MGKRKYFLLLSSALIKVKKVHFSKLKGFLFAKNITELKFVTIVWQKRLHLKFSCFLKGSMLFRSWLCLSLPQTYFGSCLVQHLLNMLTTILWWWNSMYIGLVKHIMLCTFRRGSRGAPGARAPLTLGFEAPKLSFFGPYLIFPYFFGLTSLGILFL